MLRTRRASSMHFAMPSARSCTYLYDGFRVVRQCQYRGESGVYCFSVWVANVSAPQHWNKAIWNKSSCYGASKQQMHGRTAIGACCKTADHVDPQLHSETTHLESGPHCTRRLEAVTKTSVNCSKSPSNVFVQQHTVLSDLQTHQIPRRICVSAVHPP